MGPDEILGTSLAISETGDSIRIMAPTNANIALLQPPKSSKPYRTRSMEFSQASTGGNTDISIIRADDSHYGEDDNTDNESNDDCGNNAIQRFYERQAESIDAPDFTVVSCPLEESTEILHFHTIKPSSQNGYSGTDSDIEVLMSEEINDTEWSAALENLQNNVLELGGKDDCSIEAILSTSLEENTPASIPSRRRESTEHDCSVAEFSQQSSFDGAGLSREQLIDMVREQRIRIHELESTLTRYRGAQQTFFDHVETLRVELTSSSLEHITLD